MHRFESQLSDAPSELACDEALLLSAQEGVIGEVIRTWEFDRPVVVLGRSSKVAEQVDQSFCQERGIPILRRCSGGASVVGGPGCFFYSVVLEIGDRGLRKIDVAHQFVMQRVLSALRVQVPEARLQGICDLTLDDRKFSGNSLKIARTHVLYHGTILYDADLDLLDRCLEFAPRQPEYRAQRKHRDFVANVAIDPMQFVQDLQQQFEVRHSPVMLSDSPLIESRMRELLKDRYNNDDWHLRH